MEFSRQEYWSELPCPPPGDLSDSEMESASPALAGVVFTAEPRGISIYSHTHTAVNQNKEYKMQKVLRG